MVEFTWRVRNSIHNKHWSIVAVHNANTSVNKDGDATGNLPADNFAVDDGKQRVLPNKPDAKLAASNRKLEPDILHNRRRKATDGVQRRNGNLPAGAGKPKHRI